MPIRITWDKETLGVIEYRIYKDTSPINTASPPAPLAIQSANDAATYIDTAVVDGTTYYYRVSFTAAGAVETFSNEIVFVGETFSPSNIIGTNKAIWIEATEVASFYDASLTQLTNLSQAEGSEGIRIGQVDNLAPLGGNLTPTLSGNPRLAYDGKHAFIAFAGQQENLRINNTDVIQSVDYALVAIAGKNFEAYFDGVGNNTGIIDWLFRIGENGIFFNATDTASPQFGVKFENTLLDSDVPIRFPEMKPLIVHFKFIEGGFDVYTSDGAGGVNVELAVTGGTSVASANTTSNLIIGGTDSTNINDLEAKIMSLNSFLLIGSDTAFTLSDITELSNYLVNKMEAIA